jgi:tetratricopeptide (TPR) repeat protein
VFNDDCHWTTATYNLLSEIIAKIIMKQDFNKDVDLTTSKEEFNKHLLEDRCILSRNYGSVDYFVKNHFDDLYNNYQSQIEEFRKDSTKKQIYDKILTYAYCLYNNKHKDLALQILKELVSLEPNNIEAYLALKNIYFKEQNIQKSKEYFNIIKEKGLQ